MELMTTEIATELLAKDMEVRESTRGAIENKRTVVKYFCPWGAASWFIYSGTAGC